MTMKYENDIKILLDDKIFKQLILCVEKARPNEACGLIFGDIKQIDNPDSADFQYHYISKKFTCIESNHKSPVGFLINDMEKLNKIFREASRTYNLRLISIFHSHPSGAHPSGIDTRNMEFLDNCGIRAFKNQIWTIISARSKKLNGFILLNNEFLQVDVKIKND